MRAAFVTTNLKGGGAEKAVLTVARGLAARGNEAHVVLLEHLLEHAAVEGLAIHALSRPGRARSKGWLGKRATALALRREFHRLQGERAFDLIVSTLPYCDEVVALAGLEPAWFRIANTLSAEIDLLGRASRAKAERRRRRYQRLYGRANLLAVSQGVARDLSVTLQMAQANIVQLYNPIDVPAIRKLARQAIPAEPPARYILHAGRFAPQKRHDLLFDALRLSRLPHRLVLLSAASPALERLIADKGVSDRVTIAGFQANPYPWMARADLLVLCSDHEGMPNVLVEALACGTRVVSTDCPSGPRELLQGPLARYLVPCGDARALAGAMRSALEAPRPEAPAMLEQFDPARVYAQYEALPRMWRAA
jgi:glycosyltransferase involved in cell wall biosynthesis